ESP
ncbi:hypothetical protein ACN42_g11775, partial [Penicillium freii]